jgi:hypothetical protein
VTAVARPIAELTTAELAIERARQARALRKAAGFTVLLEAFSKIESKPLRWLWPNRIPLGKLTIIAGDPGLGKSLLSLDLAARVSRGYSLPDGERAGAGDVILVSAEDDPGDTIRARLEAAGADLERIHFLQGSFKHNDNGKSAFREFNLGDVEALADALDAIEEQGRTVRLIVIDPLSAFLGGVDDISNGEVRGVLRPLSELAARRGCAVIGISHLRKGMSPVAIYRVTGSLAFVGAARAVYAVIRDPEDRERRLFIPVKCNLSPDFSGLAYKIESADGVPFLHWEEGAVDQGADSLLAESGGEHRSELEEAVDWLRDVLSEGPLPAVDLQRQAREAGIAMRTVIRAKRSAGAVSRREGKSWSWTLQDCQECQDSHSGNVGHLGNLETGAEQ